MNNIDDNESEESNTTANPIGVSRNTLTILDRITEVMRENNVPQEVIEQYRADAINTLVSCSSPHNT